MDAPNATGRVYKDFDPTHTVVTGEPATHTLSVDLTNEGFKKEHIRVQLVRNKRLVVVRGERPVDGDGKLWRRFKLEFQVADSCDVNGIHARLDGGFVRVAMPDVKALPSAIVVRGGHAAASAGKQEPAAAAKTDAAGGGKQEEESVPKQKDGAGAAIPGPTTGRGYSYVHLTKRRKLVTSVVGTVLVLFCLGVYVRYSVGP